MTEFDMQVRDAVIALAGNRTNLSSYKAIAIYLGRDPGSNGMAIGHAMGRIYSEIGDGFPWWRVLGSDLQIQEGPQAEEQERKLREEFAIGLSFTKSKVALFETRIHAKQILGDNYELHKDTLKIA